MTELRTREIDTVLGTLTAVASPAGLRALEWPDAAGRPAAAAPHDDGLLARVAEQLRAYLAGSRRTFDVPLDLSGTDFQRAVWGQLETIPYGGTVSYGRLASAIGRPRAARAVGAAVGRNPVPIVLPCHRVVGADGTLTGYGGGLGIKQRLLALEGGLP